MDKKFIVGILCQNGKCLAEKRKKDEKYFPGDVVFPGGHIKENEKPEEAVIREMKEELGVLVFKYTFIGDFYYKDGACSKVYAITQWEEDPKPLDSEKLFWISDESQLSNEIDKKMFKKVKDIKK